MGFVLVFVIFGEGLPFPFIKFANFKKDRRIVVPEEEFPEEDVIVSVMHTFEESPTYNLRTTRADSSLSLKSNVRILSLEDFLS